MRTERRTNISIRISTGAIIFLLFAFLFIGLLAAYLNQRFTQATVSPVCNCTIIQNTTIIREGVRECPSSSSPIQATHTNVPVLDCPMPDMVALCETAFDYLLATTEWRATAELQQRVLACAIRAEETLMVRST